MRLKSAVEDFEANTLNAVRGLLGRLSYVGRLHDDNGTYDHWGLAKVYGDDAAQCAMRTSHRVLLSEVLKRPLVVLLKDVPESCSNEHLTERELLTTLAQSPPRRNRETTRAPPRDRPAFKLKLVSNSSCVQIQPGNGIFGKRRRAKLSLMRAQYCANGCYN